MIAFVLMTAMPPTMGHLQLVQFASNLKDVEHVEVLVCTQPHEPFPEERVQALRDALPNNWVHHFDQPIEQNPEAEGFWDMWKGILLNYGVYGFSHIIVASEPYGKKLADIMGCKFMPYDIDRQLNSVKASNVRQQPRKYFDQIIPEFREYLRTRITIFGAESTGKTTLANALGKRFKAPVLYEYARPYLENVENVITVDSMTDIWSGQKALQEQPQYLDANPFIIQDTDLFSTVGYWQFPHWQESIGSPPQGLIDDALRLKSDLYLITPSNIPFEKDPLRYGGDHREGSDEYWINVCKQYNLPYVVLRDNDMHSREMQSAFLISEEMAKKFKKIRYDRKGL